jgi:membrane protein YdbS with pleckstrin-like domain
VLELVFVVLCIAIIAGAFLLPRYAFKEEVDTISWLVVYALVVYVTINVVHTLYKEVRAEMRTETIRGVKP